MPIVIAHIVHYPKSGIGTLVRQLTHQDSSGRYRYIVIFLQTDPISMDQYAGSSISIVGLSFKNSPVTSLFKLKRILQGSDIIHTHSFLPQLLSFLVSSSSKHHVRTVHNSYPYFSAPDLRSNIKRFVEGWLVKKTAADIVSVSKDVQRALPWKPKSDSRSIVIENGLILDEIQRAGSCPVRNNKLAGVLFVALGRLERQKGFDILLEAMSTLKDQYAEHAGLLQLWIIGDGSERAALEQQTLHLGLSTVQFLGYQTNPYRYLSCADVFVLPSRFEGFALAAIEALALKLPVILTDIGGIASELEHGESAHIVPKENPHKLAEAMKMLFERADYRSKLAENGQLFAQSRYSIDSCAKKYDEIYSRAN